MTETTSTALERRAPVLMTRPEIILNDEIDRLFRVAKGLAMSRVYKDVTQAEQAFAKLMVGHELGLNVSQSMSIYFVEGQVTVPYPLLGMFVRQQGYDFRYLTLTDELVEIEFGRGEAPGRDERGAWIYWPEAIDISRFSLEDAITAGIATRQKDGSIVTMTRNGAKPSMYAKFPRNMLVARAMSNGVRWFVQSATGGTPLYVHGEIPEARMIDGAPIEDAQVTLTTVAADIPSDLRDRFYAAYQQATELRPGQVTPAAVQMSVKGQTPDRIRQYIESIEYENEKVPDPVREEPPLADPSSSRSERSVTEIGGEEAEKSSPEDVESLRRRLAGLLDLRDSLDPAEGDLDQVNEEIALVEESLRDLGAGVPGQESLL